MTIQFELPTIEINSSYWYTILKIMLVVVAAFLVVAINVISVSASSLPENTTDWDFGLEFTDDNDKEEEQEEIEDEREHSEESKDWNENGWTKLK